MVSVALVTFVRCVDAESVDVLMVELHDEFFTMTFGTGDDDDVLLGPLAAAITLALALLPD